MRGGNELEKFNHIFNQVEESTMGSQLGEEKEPEEQPVGAKAHARRRRGKKAKGKKKVDGATPTNTEISKVDHASGSSGWPVKVSLTEER
ncbi:unnamed protein product, partial [Amoebophrya sp. A25]|eukprot:GSA25T00020421001.1